METSQQISINQMLMSGDLQQMANNMNIEVKKHAHETLAIVTENRTIKSKYGPCHWFTQTG